MSCSLSPLGAPHYNSVFRVLESESLTPILAAMIVESSLPLKAVEQDFAVDSSGFTTSRFERWFDHKYGKPRQQHDWAKVHICVGVKTQIVTAVEIHDRNTSDTPQLPPLLKTTRTNFAMREVSADKVYCTVGNLETIAGLGAVPYVPFKSIHSGKAGGFWAKAYHFFQFKREEFVAHYHKRSNIESTFSMVKRKFGDSVRSKATAAMKNEVLCKLLCHNLCVLIQEMHELGIQADFSASKVHCLPQKSAVAV